MINQLGLEKSTVGDRFPRKGVFQTPADGIGKSILL